MALFYLDTSAVLKRYRTERGTDVVDALYAARRKPDPMRLIGGSRSDGLVTSHFTCLEVESVAARMVRGRLLDDSAYKTLLGAFANDLDDYLGIVSVGAARLIEATYVTRDFGLRSGDSLHLACAFHAQDESKEVTIFVTSDKELLAAASSANMRFLDPEAPDAMQTLKKYLDG